MMKHYMINLLNPALFLVAAALALPVSAADAAPASKADTTTTTKADSNATIKMDDLREDVKANKRQLVADNMNLTDAEAKAFWPVYEAYQQDLYKINQRMVKVINDYALAYNKGAVLSDTAKSLMDEAIAIELAEANLKKSYVPKLVKVIPPAKAARYIQIETKIRALIRYQLADQIPLVD